MALRGYISLVASLTTGWAAANEAAGLGPESLPSKKSMWLQRNAVIGTLAMHTHWQQRHPGLTSPEGKLQGCQTRRGNQDTCENYFGLMRGHDKRMPSAVEVGYATNGIVVGQDSVCKKGNSAYNLRA